GRLTGKPLKLPLSGAAAEIINIMARFQKIYFGKHCEFIFAHLRALTRKGTLDGRPIGPAFVQNVFDQVIDRPGLTVYGFRGQFCTWAYEQCRYHPDAIELSLGHLHRVIRRDGRPKRDKTREAYDHAELIPQRRQLMEDWARFVLAPTPA